MNKDTHTKIRQLAEQMKRQQDWQTVPSKKGKKIAESLGIKDVEASTEAKTFSTEKMVPIGTSGQQALSPTGKKGLYRVNNHKFWPNGE